MSYQYFLSYDGCTGSMGNLQMIKCIKPLPVFKLHYDYDCDESDDLIWTKVDCIK